jgi:methionyl-tRNA formyltransferase
VAADLVDTPTDVPSPGTLAEDGESVGAGSGAVRLVQVQPEGKGPMMWSEFAKGAQPKPGETFG